VAPRVEGDQEREFLEGARRLAARHRVRFRFVECRADPEATAARLAERDAQGAHRAPAWKTIAARYAARWEPPEELPEQQRVVVDTTRPLEETIAGVAAALPPWPEQRGA
jgi:predicted kinase